MNYRFQKITTVYDIFLKQFLADTPFYELLPYQELYNKFVNTWYSLSNFFARHMQALGNEAQDLFASIEPMQKAWAREHDVKYCPEKWLKEIILAQISDFQPDILFLQDLSLFDKTFRQELKQAYNKNLFIIGWRGAPSGGFSSFEDLDLVLTPGPHFVQRLRDCGAKAELFPLGFEQSVLQVVRLDQEREFDFVFAGSLGSRNGVHSQRYALVEKLLNTTPLEVWGYINELPSQKSRFLHNAVYQANKILSRIGLSEVQKARIPVIRRGIYWEENPAKPTLRERHMGRIHSPVFGLQYYKLLARAKITLNVHADLAENYAGNMRLFEATGMGSCLITEWKENLPDLFEPEAEVVTYRSVEECIEKVRYLLAHEKERQSIASAGQKRTLIDHTFTRRVKWLDKRIKRILKNGSGGIKCC
jgi:spore maturation protein CgeB